MEAPAFQNLPLMSLCHTNFSLANLFLTKIELENELIVEINRNAHLQQLMLLNQNVKQSSKNAYSGTLLPTEDASVSIGSDSSFKCSELRQIPKKLRGKESKIKNQSKNIPKNFGKAIITFIEHHPNLVRKALSQSQVSYESFLFTLKEKKKGVNSIAELRSLWLEEEFFYAKEMRAISQYFFKRGALRYIFRSRVSNYKGHIKYRKRLLDVLKDPLDFTSIKTD